MNRLQWIALLFGGVAAFHVASYRAPAIHDDDATLVNLAVHGSLSYAAPVIPYGQPQFAHRFGQGVIPGYLLILRTAQRLAPAHRVAAARLPALLAFLAGLAGLLWLLRNLGFSAAGQAGGLMIGVSFLAFNASHFVRPEGLVFLVLILNVVWFFTSQVRFVAFLAGLAAALSLSIHPAGVFMLMSLPGLMVIQDGAAALRQPRYAWWIVGAAAGLLGVIRWVDADQAAQFFVLTQGANVEQPPLLAFKGNLPVLLVNAWEYLCLEGPKGNPWFLGVLAFQWAAAFWSLRRWRRLDRPERGVLAFGLLIFMSMSIALAHRDGHYLIYLLPWFFINLFVAIEKLWRGEWTLAQPDGIALALSAIFVLVLSSVVTSPAVLMAVVLGSLGWMGWAGWFAGVGSLIAGLAILQWIDPSTGPSLWALALEAFHWRPGLLLAALLLPALLIWILRFRWATRLVCAACFGILITWLGRDAASMAHDIRAAQPNLAWLGRLRLLRPEQTILGPAVLTLEKPGLRVQSAEALQIPERAFHVPVDVARAIARYHPDVILWPEHTLHWMTAKLVSEGVADLVEYGPVWVAPYGPYREMRVRDFRALNRRLRRKGRFI